MIYGNMIMSKIGKQGSRKTDETKKKQQQKNNIIKGLHKIKT